MLERERLPDRRWCRRGAEPHSACAAPSSMPREVVLKMRRLLRYGSRFLLILVVVVVAGSALSSASDSAESLFVCALAFSGRDVRFRWWLPRHEVREPIFQHVFAAGWDSLPRHRGPQVQDDRLLDSR